jgi:ribonuclease HII
MLRYERQAYTNNARLVAGIDEAGRGPLAGPVVAAAVILPRDFQHELLTDSKQLTAQQRDRLHGELTVNSAIAWAVGSASVEEIDRLNILRATWLAMQRAVDGLRPPPDHVLIDGLPVKTMTIPQTAIVGGDGKSYSIAAASVIAKVTRDRLMLQLDQQFPQYHFAQHKGYGTADHLAALRRFGPSVVHRRSFAPVRHAAQLVQLELAVDQEASTRPATATP